MGIPVCCPPQPSRVLCDRLHNSQPGSHHRGLEQQAVVPKQVQIVVLPNVELWLPADMRCPGNQNPAVVSPSCIAGALFRTRQRRCSNRSPGGCTVSLLMCTTTTATSSTLLRYGCLKLRDGTLAGREFFWPSQAASPFSVPGIKAPIQAFHVPCAVIRLDRREALHHSLRGSCKHSNRSGCLVLRITAARICDIGNRGNEDDRHNQNTRALAASMGIFICRPPSS